jgi:hypothetical protein
MNEMIERVAKVLYSDDPEDWDDALRIVNGTFGGEGFMQKHHPDTQARYKGDMDEARDKARAVSMLVIEECACELETSYPDHAWLNAACAAIRSLSNSGAPQPRGESAQTNAAQPVGSPYFECPGCGRDIAEPHSVCAPDCPRDLRT